MIRTFEELGKQDIPKAGGKGANLGVLAQAGLPVPPGFVLTVDFFAPWLAALQDTTEWRSLQAALHAGRDLSAPADALKARCTELHFASAQEEALAAALPSLPPDALLAVRSSSPQEDLAAASFAGGYETSLGVVRDDLPDAIRRCFASACWVEVDGTNGVVRILDGAGRAQPDREPLHQSA